MARCTVLGTLCLLIFTSWIGDATAARILGLFPAPAKSHNIVFQSLMKELASRGHDVVVVTSFPQTKPLPNYTDISIEISLKKLPELMKDVTSGDNNPVKEINMLWTAGNYFCDQQLSSPEVQALINSDEKFDLVVMELFFSECYLGFVHKFQAPLIFMISQSSLPWGNHQVANPAAYSHVPSTFLPFTDRMSFGERFVNAMVGILTNLGRSYYYMPTQQDLARRFFGESVPSLLDIERNTSLMLVNGHFSMNYPRANVPNMVEVGGMHCRPGKPLSKDLKNFLDEAKNGAIYFSLGSVIKSSDLKEEQRKILVEVFSELPQRVLWKWETDSLPGQPKNVKLGKWMPQQDILAHPNVQLFISHCGLLGTQEAVFHGVPVLGFPFYGDQELNIKRCRHAGFAEMLNLFEMSKEELRDTLKKMLNDPSYRNNAKRISAVYRDQPETPLERAVFWTEYVIRHKGAHHMRSAAMDLTWYEYFLVDVVAVVVLAVAVVVGGLFLAFRTVYRFLFKSNQKSKPAKGTGAQKKSKSKRE